MTEDRPITTNGLGDNGGKGRGPRITSVEIITVFAISAIPMIFLVEKIYMGSPMYWIGFILMVGIIGGLFLLFRLRYNRIGSSLGCGSTIVIISFIYTGINIYITNKSNNKPIEMSIQSIDHGARLLSPVPFVKTGSIVSKTFEYMTTYDASDKRIEIKLEEFKAQNGLVVDDPQGLLMQQVVYVGKNFKRNSKERELAPLPIDGIPSYRVDFSVSNREESDLRPEIYIVKLLIPNRKMPLQKGTFVTVVAKRMKPEQRDKELERIISSIQFPAY
jgi:hypothetical protein